MPKFIQDPSDSTTWINVDLVAKFTYVEDKVQGTNTYTAFSSDGKKLFSRQYKLPLQWGENPTTWALETFGVPVP